MKTKQETRPSWSGMMMDIVSGMAEWRQQHAQATLREIEAEIDKRWVRVRARMVEELAVASAAADWRAAGEGKQPVCPSCGGALQAEGGKKPRHLQTQGGEEIVLERRYGVCPTCKAGFFPPG